MNDIVYFACNDWNPTPKEADNICYNYLGSYTTCSEKVVNKTADDVEQWLIDNKICINCDIIDMSLSYYITAPRKVFETYFKELLPYVKDKPYNFIWIDDSKYFLDYKEENFGSNFI